MADEEQHDHDSALGEDEEQRDRDSTLGEDEDDLSTQSLSSSILNYQYENGRRYHAHRDGQYFMPNDDQEQEGMDLMHHVSQMILGGELYRAPVSEPLEILEIGTGTGIWALDVADKFPQANVTATDLSPIQPNWIPPNLQYEIDDCETPWTFKRSFDFIHMRNLSGAIADWPKLFQECFDHLKPGGWIECSNIEAWGQSANGSLTAETASLQWQTQLKAAAAAVNRELNIGPQLQGLISATGFTNVKDDKYQVPTSRWMPGRAKKKLAFFFQHLVMLELEALSLRLYTGVLGWTPEQLQLLLVDVRKEIKNPDFQMYSTMYEIQVEIESGS